MTEGGRASGGRRVDGSLDKTEASLCGRAKTLSSVVNREYSLSHTYRDNLSLHERATVSVPLHKAGASLCRWARQKRFCGGRTKTFSRSHAARTSLDKREHPLRPSARQKCLCASGEDSNALVLRGKDSLSLSLSLTHRANTVVHERTVSAPLDTAYSSL